MNKQPHGVRRTVAQRNLRGSTTMAVDAIGVVSSNTSELARNSAISQANFLQLLLAQLRTQDPLEPTDNQQFVTQLASFSALEINRQQSERVENLLTVQAVTQSIGLIGKNIELRTAQGNSNGMVTALSIVAGEPRLTINANGANIVGVRPSDVVLVR
jgi:flagellar basal-body rod modification protein FlgD